MGSCWPPFYHSTLSPPSIHHLPPALHHIGVFPPLLPPRADINLHLRSRLPSGFCHFQWKASGERRPCCVFSLSNAVIQSWRFENYTNRIWLWWARHDVVLTVDASPRLSLTATRDRSTAIDIISLLDVGGSFCVRFYHKLRNGWWLAFGCRRWAIMEVFLLFVCSLLRDNCYYKGSGRDGELDQVCQSINWIMCRFYKEIFISGN